MKGQHTSDSWLCDMPFSNPEERRTANKFIRDLRSEQLTQHTGKRVTVRGRHSNRVGLIEQGFDLNSPKDVPIHLAERLAIYLHDRTDYRREEETIEVALVKRWHFFKVLWSAAIRLQRFKLIMRLELMQPSMTREEKSHVWSR